MADPSSVSPAPSLPPPPPAASWKLVVFAVFLTAGTLVDLCAFWPSLDDRLRLVEAVTVGQYVVLAGVSVFTAQWPIILAVNVVAGLLYLAATRWTEARLLGPRVIVVSINRHLGHLEALFPWVVLSVAVPCPYLPWTLRAAMLGALVLFAAGWMDWVTVAGRQRGWLRAGSPDDPLAVRWRHNVQRRLLLIGISALGFVLLALVAWSQIPSMLPLWLAFLPGVVFRVVDLRHDPSRKLEPAQRALVQRVLRVADAADFAVLVASQIAITAVVWTGLHPGIAADAEDVRVRGLPVHLVPGTGKAPPTAEALAAAPSPPRDPPIRLFVIADSQLHELSGARSGVQLDIADSIINVAVRPVELDLLSMFSVARLERARRALAERFGQPLPWVHLGDFADLGCESELERFPAVRAGLGAPLAIAVGNHDSAFCGNFAWHPSWDPACGAQPRADKAWSDHLLHGFSPSSEDRTSWGTPYLPALVSLGHVDGAEVVGVFLDTSDFTMPSLGMAGLQGDVSGAQERWLDRRLTDHPGSLVVFFMHHPFAELSLTTQWRMGHIADALGPRVLGLVSAHTHLAALRWPTVGERAMPEFVVGSTIDPPQEGAVLEIGKSDEGRVVMRVVTVPVVAREGATCGEETTGVPSRVCDDLWAKVQSRCTVLAAAPVSTAHPRTPADVKTEQQARARLLLDCLPRLGLPAFGTPAAPGYPLDDATVTRSIDRTASDLLRADASEGDLLDQLACLSWVGSVEQAHKPDSVFHRAFAIATSASAVSSATDMVADANGGVQRACGASGGSSW